MKLISEASLQIQKPIEEVFETISNPDHLTKFFISESNGPMEDGKDLLWKFPEFDQRFPITKVKINAPHSISFIWDPFTIVKIKLTSFNENSTVVKVTEGGKELNEENLKWLISNVGGWANFLASMKAYAEYGVELRKGAYDFIKTQKSN